MAIEKNNERGLRLKQERLSRKLSQAELGEIIGKKSLAILRYEKGERAMGQEDIEALYKAGFDIWYLITGLRTNIHPLPSDELEILELFQKVDPSQRQTLLTLVQNFAESFALKKD